MLVLTAYAGATIISELLAAQHFNMAEDVSRYYLSCFLYAGINKSIFNKVATYYCGCPTTIAGLGKWMKLLNFYSKMLLYAFRCIHILISIDR